MRRFITTVFGVAIFFVGVGALVDKAGAKFKSDEKALELVRKARQAIGGDTAISSIQSLQIAGETTRTIKGKGAERASVGKTEIAFQFPDKFMKSTSIGDATGESVRSVERSTNFTVTSDEPGEIKLRVGGEGRGEGIGAGSGTGSAVHIMIKKDDGTVQELTGADAEKWIADHHGTVSDGPTKIMIKKSDGTTDTVVGEAKLGEVVNDGIVVRKMKDGDGTGEAHAFKINGDNVMLNRVGGHDGLVRHNDMLRLSLGLLLTAPKGMDVEYSYGGQANLDGTACEVVNASFGGQTYRLFLDGSSYLPVAMKFKGESLPQIVTFTRRAPGSGEPEEATGGQIRRPAGDDSGNVTFTAKVPEGAAPGEKGNYLFKRIEGGPAGSTEFTVKFSDYRSVNGVLLPFTWTQTGGEADETFVVSNYEANAANIADRFSNQKVMLRSKKADDNK